MKELEPHSLITKDKIEISVKKQQEIEYVLQGTINPKKGQKVFELNEETGEIKEAKYKSDTTVFNTLSKITPSKLIINADCIYIPALNAENAKKKYLKNKDQSFYYSKPAPFNINDITF